MAGLLTGVGDVSIYNSGTNTITGSRTQPVPANTVVGDVLIAVFRTGRTASGMTVGTPTGWTKICDTHFDSRLSNYVDGAIYFRVATSADIGSSPTFSTSTGANRQYIGIFRTTGIDATALASMAPVTPTEVINTAATNVATLGSVTPSGPSINIRVAAFNVTADRAPFAGISPALGDTAYSVSDPYNTGTGGTQAITSMYVGSSEFNTATPTTGVPLPFQGRSDGGTGRAVTSVVSLPAIFTPQIGARMLGTTGYVGVASEANASNGATVTLSFPVLAQANDVLIVALSSTANSGSWSPPDASWALVVSWNVQASSQAVYAKRVFDPTTEPSAYVFTNSVGGGLRNGLIATARGVDLNPANYLAGAAVGVNQANTRNDLYTAPANTPADALVVSISDFRAINPSWPVYVSPSADLRRTLLSPAPTQTSGFRQQIAMSSWLATASNPSLGVQRADQATPAFGGSYITFVLPAAPARTGQPKIWNGSVWVNKPAKVWNGSAWVIKPVKFWNGTSWVLAK